MRESTLKDDANDALKPPSSPRQAKRRRALGILATSLTLTSPVWVPGAVHTAQSARQGIEAAGHGVSGRVGDLLEQRMEDQTQKDLERVKGLPADQKVIFTVDPNGEPLSNIARGFLDENSDLRPLTSLIQAQIAGNDQPQSVEVPLSMIEHMPKQELLANS